MAGHRRALVTGASRGIGAAVARALAPHYEVLLGGRDGTALAELAESLPAALPWQVELTDFAALAAAVADIDSLDVLVHSAGVWEPGLVEETGPEAWRRIFDTNLFAVAELTRLLLPALRITRGRVILVNSTAGRRASPRRGAYAASKFALRAFAEALGSEEAHNGVSVTSVYPGRVATGMQRKVRQDERGRFEPNEYLSPDAVAEAILAAVLAPAGSQLTEIVITPSTARTQTTTQHAHHDH